MIASEHAEIHDVIDRLWQEMGGVGTKDDVLVHLIPTLPGHLTDYLLRQGLAAKIGGYFRAHAANGLPSAPEIDSFGTHKQLELMDVSEFRYVIARRMKDSRANRLVAEKFRDECYEVHGVVIDVDSPYTASA